MNSTVLILSAFLFVSQVASAGEAQSDMDAAKIDKTFEEIENLKAKHTQNFFKDTQGLSTQKETLEKIASNFDNGDEIIIKFQYDKSHPLDPSQFPITDELIDHENQAYNYIEAELKAGKPKLRKQFNELAVAELEKLKELKRKMMSNAENRTFTTTVRLTDLRKIGNEQNPAQYMARETLAGMQLKNLKIVSVDRLAAAHVNIKNSLLRSVSKGGLKKGLGGALAVGVISMSGVANAAAAKKIEGTAYKPSLKEMSSASAGGAK